MKVDKTIDILELSFLIALNRSLCFLIIIPFLILVVLSKWSGFLMVPLSIVGFFLDWEMRTIGKLIIGGILLFLSGILLEAIVSNIYNMLDDSYRKSLYELKNTWVKNDINEN